VREYTTRDGIPLIDSWWKTTVVDEKGNKGTGADRDKRGSIEKAHKDLRERRGYY